ncbi:MAG: hypothetical protein KGL53_11045 [Elusimicrobia bacterium]|nr:hypothetical protein [Elusimicrobiota bacterium]
MHRLWGALSVAPLLAVGVWAAHATLTRPHDVYVDGRRGAFDATDLPLPADLAALRVSELTPDARQAPPAPQSLTPVREELRAAPNDDPGPRPVPVAPLPRARRGRGAASRRRSR